MWRLDRPFMYPYNLFFYFGGDLMTSSLLFFPSTIMMMMIIIKYWCAQCASLPNCQFRRMTARQTHNMMSPGEKIERANLNIYTSLNRKNLIQAATYVNTFGGSVCVCVSSSSLDIQAMAITVLGRVIEIMPSGRGRSFSIFFLSIKQVGRKKNEKTRGTNQNAIRSVLFFLLAGETGSCCSCSPEVTGHVPVCVCVLPYFCTGACI